MGLFEVKISNQPTLFFRFRADRNNYCCTSKSGRPKTVTITTLSVGVTQTPEFGR